MNRFCKSGDKKIIGINVISIIINLSTILCVFDKTLILPIICNKCGSKDEQNLKMANQLRY